MRHNLHVTRWALLLALAAVCPRIAAAESLRRTVKVSAQSQIQLMPDEVVVSLEIATRDRDLMAAKADNDEKMQAILELCRKYRLPDNSATIESFTVTRRFDREEKTFLGYHVNRQVIFVLRDFGSEEPLISDALTAGATGLNEILLRTTKHREQQWEARRLAVARAKEKAGHLAELNGLVLGKAIEIEEGVEGDRSAPMYSIAPSVASNEHGRARIRLISAAQELADETSDGKRATPAKPQTATALGQITIQATVQITFELKEPKQP